MKFSAIINFFILGVSIAIVTVLAILAWTRTHSLDPFIGGGIKWKEKCVS